jgi:hypothetical protein
MATTNSEGGAKPATKRRSTSRSTTSKSTRARSTSRRSTTTPTQPKPPAGQVQSYAERAVLVPVGAGLLARDNLVSTVSGLVSKYSTRSGFERELKRYERRGATARNRFERQIRRSRTRFERQLRQRRSLVERTIRQNRGRIERDVRLARRDLGKQSGIVSARVERLVADAQGLIGS